MSMRFLMRRGLIYLLPVVALLVALTARLAAPDLLDRFMLVSFDLYQRIAPREHGDVPIKIVDIDEDSLNKYGQWPWSRSLDAQLVDKLRDAGAAVVAFDIVFAEPDRTSPKLLLTQLTTQRDVDPETTRLLGNLPDPDESLAAAMKSLPTIAGFILVQHSDSPPPAQKAGYAFAGDNPLQFVDTFPAAIDDLAPFQAAALGNGFLNEHVDWDQIVRRVPLIMKFGNKPVFSLVAEILRVVTGAHTYIARAAGANGEKSFGENTGLTTLRIGPLTIPTDSAGRVWVYYAKPNRDRLISAAKILSGDFDPERIKDHIVLIGTSAAGVVNDLQATPLGAGVPGVEIHAQLLEQILGGVYLTRPDWGKGAEILFVLLAGGMLILVLPRIGALASALLGIAAIVVALAISWFAFKDAHLLLDPIYPTVVLVMIYFISSILGYLRTEVRQHEIRSAFSRYMSPHYVAELARNPEKLQLGGEYKKLTVMFCDIRGFTAMSEGLDARELTHLMNSFTSPMSEIITDEKGTIDKYIGDCIMAFWNAPLDDPDHAKNAVRAAQLMRRKLVDLNRDLKAEAEASRKALSRAAGRHRHQHRRMRRRKFRLAAPLQLFAARRPGEPRVATRGLVQALPRRSRHRRGDREDAGRFRTHRARPRRRQGQVPGGQGLHAAARRRGRGDLQEPARGAARRLSQAGLDDGTGGARRGAACRGALPRAGLHALSAPHRAFPARGATHRLGRRLHG